MNSKKTVTALALGFCGLLAVSSQLISGDSLYALLMGYGAFSLNSILVVWLSQQAIGQAASSQKTGAPKWLVGLLAFIKFSLLVAVLYYAIIVWQLPILYFAGGATVGLFLFLGFFISDYLRKLSAV